MLHPPLRPARRRFSAGADAGLAQDPCAGLSGTILAAVTAFVALPPATQCAKATAAVVSKNQASTLKRYSDLYVSDYVTWCSKQGMSHFPITKAKLEAFFAARAADASSKGNPGGMESIEKALAFAVAVRSACANCNSARP